MFRDTRTIDPPIADPVYRTVQGTDVAEAAFEYKLVEFVDCVFCVLTEPYRLELLVMCDPYLIEYWRY
jgi:hypothetical protein